MAPSLTALTSSIRCSRRQLAAVIGVVAVAPLAFLIWSRGFPVGPLNNGIYEESGRLTVFFANRYLHQAFGIFGWPCTSATRTTHTMFYFTMSDLVSVSTLVRDPISAEGTSYQPHSAFNHSSLASSRCSTSKLPPNYRRSSPDSCCSWRSSSEVPTYRVIGPLFGDSLSTACSPLNSRRS